MAALRGGPLTRRPDRLPGNHPLPAVYRFARGQSDSGAGHGPGGRDAELARVEAALFAADEPLLPRKLAAAAGLPDAAAARRLVQKLRTLHEQDGTAFQIEELAGGYQLLTRPQFHRWLIRLRRAGHDVRLSAPAR